MTQSSAPHGVVIVAYNSAHVLAACLRSIPLHIPVLVADNASADDVEAVCLADGRAELLKLPDNLGFGSGANAGVKALAAEHVVIANPDVVFADGFFDGLAEKIAAYPDAGVIAPFLDRGDGAPFIIWDSPIEVCPPARQRPDLTADVCLPAVSGACLCVDRAEFLAMGGFDGRIFLFFEDDDLCRRYWDAKRAIVYAPALRAIHAPGRSTKPSVALTYKKRRHFAEASAYVRRKYGLPDGRQALARKSALRLLGALLLLRPQKIAKNLGNIAGSIKTP